MNPIYNIYKEDAKNQLHSKQLKDNAMYTDFLKLMKKGFNSVKFRNLLKNITNPIDAHFLKEIFKTKNSLLIKECLEILEKYDYLEQNLLFLFINEVNKSLDKDKMEIYNKWHENKFIKEYLLDNAQNILFNDEDEFSFKTADYKLMKANNHDAVLNYISKNEKNYAITALISTTYLDCTTYYSYILNENKNWVYDISKGFYMDAIAYDKLMKPTVYSMIKGTYLDYYQQNYQEAYNQQMQKNLLLSSAIYNRYYKELGLQRQFKLHF